jgi:hypothetical protein
MTSPRHEWCFGGARRSRQIIPYVDIRLAVCMNGVYSPAPGFRRNLWRYPYERLAKQC